MALGLFVYNFEVNLASTRQRQWQCFVEVNVKKTSKGLNIRFFDLIMFLFKYWGSFFVQKYISYSLFTKFQFFGSNITAVWLCRVLFLMYNLHK